MEANMKIKELKNQESKQLRQELNEQAKHLFTLRSQSVTEKLENPTQLHKARRTIAQIKTILRQRELEDQKTASAQAPAKA
jgi:large subunit ribosomal protein L29